MHGFETFLNPLQHGVIRWVRRKPGLSRKALTQRLGARPNSVGDAVGGLLELGLIREGVAESNRAGRPQVPLTLNASSTGRTILGIAVRGGRDGSAETVEARAVGMLGRSSGTTWRGPGGPSATRAIQAICDDRTLGVSIALPGLIEDDAEPPALPGLFAALGDLPRILDNDNHALAARWMLGQSPDEQPRDTLVVQLGDGRLGASLLIDGRPNRGVIRGGNELGHTRLPIATDRCFCGHTGCLERIASTAFMHRHGASRVRTLAELASAYPSGTAGDDHAVNVMLDALAMGVGNALQMLRPHRLVVVSEFTGYAGFQNGWFDRLRDQLFPELRERIVFECWDRPLSSPAESAAHLGLAALFDGRW
ncbi:MAG: ROK family transcriptional regulator [Planctomycetota bacterium]